MQKFGDIWLRLAYLAILEIQFGVGKGHSNSTLIHFLLLVHIVDLLESVSMLFCAHQVLGSFLLPWRLRLPNQILC